MAKRKNPAAVALGRKGGKKYFERNLTMDRKRVRNSEGAAAKRWEKKDDERATV